MAIANTVTEYLINRGMEYSVVPHPYSESSAESADVAHVDPDQVAKAVLVRDRGEQRHYALAVLPASHSLQIHQLEDALGRRLQLADEEELRTVFPDCRLGAVPALGLAYGLDTVVETSLKGKPEIYFEAGDHEELIHVSGEQFERLIEGCAYGSFSTPEEQDTFRR